MSRWGAHGRSRAILAKGGVFHIERVGRHDMGLYLCVA